jgi:hypothetical protein
MLRARSVIETLNSECFCITLDQGALRRAVERDSAIRGVQDLIAERSPQLFASLPVFVSRRHAAEMSSLIAAVEEVVALPSFREAALAWAPAIARHASGAIGAFIGYDFHIGADGPRLIEINTNAGGGLLNAALARAQGSRCDELAGLASGPVPADGLERAFIDMFVSEWQRSGRAGVPTRIAIVDEAPAQQFLYPEFLLFGEMFRRFGISAEVRSPEQLAFEGGVLRDADGPVDLVYNRLTDFALDAPAHAALRDAYLADAAVVTPNPRAHALYADKRNLSLLTDGARLRAWGAGESTIEILQRGIPSTRIVSTSDVEALWAERRRFFFKPAGGYGSKAAYRGDKLTRRVWNEIVGRDYVAQELVSPGRRSIRPDQSLKVDIRNYAYAGKVQLLAARLYEGQTTNMRTAGGGFAAVLTPPSAPGRGELEEPRITCSAGESCR